MTPADGRARESTGARPAYDPAAERTPGARGAAPGVSLGGPSLAVPPVAGEGGYSPSPLSRGRAAATEPDPETGGSGSEPAPPVRGRAPRAPVTAGPDGTPASGPPVVTGLSGAEWRKQAKAATSALHATQRRRATRYVRKADRGAGAQFRPGMGRRMPPGAPDGGDAA